MRGFHEVARQGIIGAMTEHDPYVPPVAELEEQVDTGLSAELAARPLRLGEILQRTWTVFTGHAGPLLLGSAVIYVPLNLVLGFVLTEMENSPDQGVLDAVRLSSILYGLFGVVATLVAIQVTVDAVQGRPASRAE